MPELPFDIGDLLEWAYRNNVHFQLSKEGNTFSLKCAKGCISSQIPFSDENCLDNFKWLIFSLKTGVEYHANNPNR
jgi:hypothetical protein